MNFFAGSLAATAVVPAAAALSPAREDDPIFAVIAKHKAATEALSIAMYATYDMGGGPPDEPRNSPSHVGAQEAYDEATEPHLEALAALFTTTPTTVGGVAALLEHYASPEWPADERDTSDSESSVLRSAIDRGPEWGDIDGHFRAIAATLKKGGGGDPAGMICGGAARSERAQAQRDSACSDAELIALGSQLRTLNIEYRRAVELSEPNTDAANRALAALKDSGLTDFEKVSIAIRVAHEEAPQPSPFPDEVSNAMDPIERRIMELPAHTARGLGIKATAAADACSHWWREPFGDLDWEYKHAVALIEAVLQFAGMPLETVDGAPVDGGCVDA
jgi:hypothetical protein